MKKYNIPILYKKDAKKPVRTANGTPFEESLEIISVMMTSTQDDSPRRPKTKEKLWVINDLTTKLSST